MNWLIHLIFRNKGSKREEVPGMGRHPGKRSSAERGEDEQRREGGRSKLAAGAQGRASEEGADQPGGWRGA